MIYSSLRRHPPEKTALLTATRAWTCEELADLVEHFAALLTTRLGIGGRIALAMTAEGEAVAALLATEAVGLSAVLLPPDIEPAALQRRTEASGATHLLLPPDARVLRSAFRVVKEAEEFGTMLWAELSSQRRPVPAPDGWLLKLTSGSLGPSRLAVRSGDGVEMEIRAVAERIGLSPADRVLCASSLAHSYGLIGGLLAPLSAGATVVLLGEPERLAETIDNAQPTIIFGVSSTYRRLLDTQGISSSALRSVRLALSAGAPLPDGLFERWLDCFTNPIRQDYGTTETGTIAIDTSEAASASTVGIPLPHLEVRLAPSDRPGVDEILIRAASTARGYVEKEGILPALDGDGWYHTGDAGRLDGAGRLVLAGRIRPRLRIHGVSIAPEDVEQRIRMLPGVREVVVLAVPDELGQQQLKAVVVAPGVDGAGIHRWCREQLPSELQPALVEMRDALPRSPAGKVLQRELL